MTPLTKPKVSANALETTVLDLWQEFLARYFDGAAHAVGADSVTFPKAELNFQQSAVSQPLEKVPAGGLAITLVWSEGSPRQWKAWELVDGSRQEMVYLRAAWNFWVRASGGNARRNGKTAADCLHGLLANTAETRALSQAGIQRLKPSAPRAVQDADYTLRLVTVQATLRYPVRSQVNAE